MARFKKSGQAVEALPFERQSETAEDAAEQAAELASFAPTWDSKQQAIVAAHIADAKIRRDVETVDETIDVELVDTVSQALNESRPATAGELAATATRKRAFEKFRASHNLRTSLPPDPMFQAQQMVDLIERRRQRIRTRLDGAGPVPLSPEKRRQLEAEEQQLDEIEREHWSLLHPIALGSPFGVDHLDDEIPRLLNDETCRYCPTRLSRRERFEFGMCPTHLKMTQLLNGAEGNLSDS